MKASTSAVPMSGCFNTSRPDTASRPSERDHHAIGLLEPIGPAGEEIGGEDRHGQLHELGRLDPQGPKPIHRLEPRRRSPMPGTSTATRSPSVSRGRHDPQATPVVVADADGAHEGDGAEPHPQDLALEDGPHRPVVLQRRVGRGRQHHHQADAAQAPPPRRARRCRVDDRVASARRRRRGGRAPDVACRPAADGGPSGLVAPRDDAARRRGGSRAHRARPGAAGDEPRHGARTQPGEVVAAARRRTRYQSNDAHAGESSTASPGPGPGRGGVDGVGHGRRPRPPAPTRRRRRPTSSAASPMATTARSRAGRPRPAPTGRGPCCGPRRSARPGHTPRPRPARRRAWSPWSRRRTAPR